MNKVVVILHGWGVNGARYYEAKKILEKKGFVVFCPDLPGFGTNKTTKTLTFEDYISFVWKYIQKVTKTTKQKKIILVGHSFGGRIAIRFSSLYPELVKSLILTGASGIPQKLSVKKRIAVLATKVLKPIFLIPPFSFAYKFFRKVVYYSIGENDYYKAGRLSETFKNVYKISIVKDLKTLNVPTLIIWGEMDKVTPIKDAKVIHKSVKGSKLVVVKNATHKLPYENAQCFAQEILKSI